MKIGATITSERGKPVTKTGNDNITITLRDENGMPVCTVMFVENGLGYELILTDYDELGMIFTNFPTAEDENGSLKHGKYQCIRCTKELDKPEMIDGLTKAIYCADCWGKK